MTELARSADLITPNLTEAAILLGKAPDVLPDGQEETLEWVRLLSLEGRRSVALTGIGGTSGRIGAACVEAKTGRMRAVYSDLVDAPIHGAGDIFASVLLGALLRGKPLFKAAELAADFVRDSVRHSHEIGAPPQDGVNFEPLLADLAGKLQTSA
jgi:pyridoxine kinase